METNLEEPVFDLRVGEFYRRRSRGATIVVIVGATLLAGVVIFAFLDALSVLAPFGIHGASALALATTAAIPPSLLLGLLLTSWGVYSHRRRASALRVGALGLTPRGVSGRELYIPYDDPCVDTIPWFVPTVPKGRSPFSVAGGGAMIWIPPDAVAAIRARRELS